MVQFIQRSPSFGEQLGASVGQGANAFLQQLGETLQEKRKQERINQILGMGSNLDQDFSSNLNQNADNSDSFKKAQALTLMNQPELARIETEKGKIKEKRRTEDTKLAFAETKEYRTHVADQARAAEELDPVLNHMETLIKRGKLTNPVISKFAEKTGLIGLLDPSSQQFQGLSVGFLNNAKNVFGARITNLDLQTYIDKIPRLSQTDEGKNVLIDNFRTLGEAAKIRNKAKNQIIKENKGVPPLDLEQKVSERAAPQIDVLAEKFNKSFIDSSRSESGKILMRHPSGTLGEVDEANVQSALQKGYKLE